jgi:branched-chain amino acid transport system ATP-binding protein
MSDPSDGVILSTRKLSKSYGIFKAVDAVDLDVHQHDIHVFIGPNGAGKSTVLNMLGGQILPTSGEVYFGGKPLGASTPSRRARAGIGRSFQLTSIIPGFSCLENVVLAVQAHRGLFGLLRLRSRAEDVSLARELLALVDLRSAADVPAELLSHGQQRQLEIAVALGGRPRLLLLDEPSSGIAQAETDALGELLQRMKAHLGVTLVIIEHDMPLLMSLADRLIAMDAGKVLADGPAEDVRADPGVVESYLGADMAAIARSGDAAVPTRRSTAQCRGVTRAGERCSRAGGPDGLCAQHRNLIGVGP